MSTKQDNLRKLVVVGATLRMTEFTHGELKNLKNDEADRDLLVTKVDDEGYTVILAQPKGTHELGERRVKWPENDDLFTAGRDNFTLSEAIDEKGGLKTRRFTVTPPDPKVYSPQGPVESEQRPNLAEGGPVDPVPSAPLASPTAPAVTVEPGTESEKRGEAAGKTDKKS